MIRSFRDDVTKAVYRGECPKGFPSNILKVVRRKLAMVDAAKDLSDLRVPPNNKLHPLHGDREGQYAIRI
ncbi:MAG TPA: type II toxin-antitoxin system RelE/ParE family toxin, partial [Methyloceanibacter sp.]|nr:type II toxin-antitoxin system RelE/ParE family toxin [Methyloceanibacter sp.]